MALMPKMPRAKPTNHVRDALEAKQQPRKRNGGQGRHLTLAISTKNQELT
jgi:hypothetical protein